MRHRFEHDGEWGLSDLLAGPARELLADRLDHHLPLAGNDLQRLGDVLAHLHDTIRPAAGAAAGGLDHNALARQVFGEGFLHGLAPLEGADLGRLPLGPHMVFGGILHEVSKLQLELVEQLGAASTNGPKPSAPSA